MQKHERRVVGVRGKRGALANVAGKAPGVGTGPAAGPRHSSQENRHDTLASEKGDLLTLRCSCGNTFGRLDLPPSDKSWHG